MIDKIADAITAARHIEDLLSELSADVKGQRELRALDEAVIEAARRVCKIMVDGYGPRVSIVKLQDALAARDAAQKE